jgi:CheY-like chemotaxis protein
MQILVVEDNADLRELTAEICEAEGYQVAVAANGADALQYLATHPLPHLILLDVMMPVMNGEEFRRRQLADPRLASIPVLVLSAMNLPEASVWEGTQILAKPVNVSDLAAALKRTLG